jgi:hypothetical protein
VSVVREKYYVSWPQDEGVPGICTERREVWPIVHQWSQYSAAREAQLLDEARVTGDDFEELLAT